MHLRKHLRTKSLKPNDFYNSDQFYVIPKNIRLPQRHQIFVKPKEKKVAALVKQANVRFIQVSLPLEQIPFISAISDTQFSQDYKAINVLQGQEWRSQQASSLQTQDNWLGMFSHVQRITELNINFLMSPKELKIEISEDTKQWSVASDWQACNPGLKDVQSVLDACQNPGQALNMEKHKKFYKKIVFEQPIYFKFIKIYFKGFVFGYVAIDQIKAFSQDFVVQIRNMYQKERNECLTVLNGDFSIGNQVATQDCIHSIVAGDDRELFIVKPNQQIQTLVGKLCLTVEQLHKDAKIVLANCGEAATKGDLRDQWETYESGWIKSLMDNQYCIENDNNEINQINGISVKANSTQTNSDANFVFNQDGFWSSWPGHRFVKFEISFQKSTIQKITINWKYTPKSFEIHVQQGKYWRTIEEEEDNQASQYTLELNFQKYSGIRIFLKDTKQTDSQGQTIYGIKDLKISTGSKSVFMNYCFDKEGLTDLLFKKWQLFDVHVYDQKNEIELDAEKQILYGKVQDLVKMVGQIKSSGQYIPKLMNNAKQFKKLIEEMDQEFAIIEKQLKQFDRKYYKSSFQQPMSLNGNTQKNPAKSCADIQTQVPSKKSGFFWIKSDCMPNPLRLYCDMTNDQQTYYYIGKFMRDDHLGLKKYNSIGDIRQECAEYGLDPVDISNPQQMTTLKKYLKEIEVTIDDHSMIPVAYDYGCDNKKCNGQWRSLKSSNSEDRSDMFQQFLNKRNQDDHVQEAISEDEQHNVLGFGLSLEGLSTFKLGEGAQYPVKGMICSLNKLEDKITELTCESKPRGQNIFDGSFGKNFKVHCPAGCAENEAEVFGTSVYTDQSSICRAAIHNGVIDDKGGYFIFGIELGKVYYEGSQNNKIKSLEFQKPWDRSFIVDYFKILCPIDKLFSATKTSKTSFIQKSEIISGIDADGKNYKFVQTLQEDPNELGTQQTNQMLDKLNEIMQQEFNALQKQNSIGLKVKTLAEEVSKQLGVMTEGDLSAKDINLQLKESEEFELGLSQAMEQSIKAGKEKSLTLNRLKSNYIKQIKQMNKNVGFNETYAENIEDIWDVFSSPLVENKTISEWQYTVESIQPHTKAITQAKEMDLRIYGKYGTFITLKEKEYYDGQFEMSFKMGNDGCVGMIFRYTDPFNYYAFDICRGELKEKRFLKIKNGESTVLAKIEDGGVMQQLWYRVMVQFENNRFKAYVREEDPLWVDESHVSIDQLELVLETNDEEFSQGTIGVGINKALGVYFDKISYKPKECVVKIQDPNVYVPQDSNRWYDTFRTDIGMIWEPYDPQFQINGPSRWTYQARVMDQLNVVAQSSRLYSVEDEVPALLKLKLHKYALYGVSETLILMNENDFSQDNMYIGVAFKVVSKFEYLSFEVGQNICRIRKYYANFNPDDKRDVIVEDLVKSDCSIKVLTWYRVLVVIDKNQNINVKLGHNDDMKTVLSFKYIPEKDKMEHRGTIGLITYKCKAYFTLIKMGPAEEFDIPQDPSPEIKQNDVKQEDNLQDKEEVKKCDSMNSNENINGTQPKISLQVPTTISPKIIKKALKQVGKKIKYKSHQEKNKADNNQEPIQCWERIQTDDKQEFCASKYSEQNLIQICNENFNQICCDQSFDDKQKSHDCVKKCQSADKPNDLPYDLAVHCINSKEKQPLYDNCSHLYFEQEHQISNCKNHLCNLCCVEINVVTNTNPDQKVSNDCAKKCDSTFPT